MTSDGYCLVQDILQHFHPKMSKITSLEDHIRPVVETNDKQRFRLELRPAQLFEQQQRQRQQTTWSIIPLTPEQAASITPKQAASITPEQAAYRSCLSDEQHLSKIDFVLTLLLDSVSTLLKY
jgi:hypothetical protein